MSWTVQVPGICWPKGSHTAITRGKHAAIVEQAQMNHPKEWAAWEAAVLAAGQLIASRLDSPIDGPVTVEITFTLPRPGSRIGDPWPHLKPSRTCPGGGDVDKLSRFVLDAFTRAGVWTDDSRVVDLHPIKTYPLPDGLAPLALPEPGAVIRVDHAWVPQLTLTEGEAS